MQREIKFRAWDKRKKIMRDVECIGSAFAKSEVYDTVNGREWVMNDHIELMQYTGLKDKNGKEIYEGDIIDISYCFAGNGIVKFGKYKQCDMSSDYECGNQGFYVDSMKDTDMYRHDLYYYAHFSEVIGNIHDNP